MVVNSIGFYINLGTGPTILLEINPIPDIEDHAFGLEKLTLVFLASTP
jgi:hypothetical protein